MVTAAVSLLVDTSSIWLSSKSKTLTALLAVLLGAQLLGIGVKKVSKVIYLALGKALIEMLLTLYVDCW